MFNSHQTLEHKLGDHQNPKSFLLPKVDQLVKPVVCCRSLGVVDFWPPVTKCMEISLNGALESGKDSWGGNGPQDDFGFVNCKSDFTFEICSLRHLHWDWKTLWQFQIISPVMSHISSICCVCDNLPPFQVTLIFLLFSTVISQTLSMNVVFFFLCFHIHPLCWLLWIGSQWIWGVNNLWQCTWKGL